MLSPERIRMEKNVAFLRRRLALSVGALAYIVTLVPVSAPAAAQSWESVRTCRGLEGRSRVNCERERKREDERNRARDREQARWERDRYDRKEQDRRGRDRDRREWERKKRKDAKKDGVVAGAVGAVVVGGIVAAIASSENKKKKERQRREYCEDRYGTYDVKSDTYRASDGRWYPCE